jgi:hypothetical protein
LKGKVCRKNPRTLKASQNEIPGLVSLTSEALNCTPKMTSINYPGFLYISHYTVVFIGTNVKHEE